MTPGTMPAATTLPCQTTTVTGAATARPGLMTAREAAERLRVGVRLVYQLVSRREIRAARIGGAIRISEAALAEYLAHATTAPRWAEEAAIRLPAPPRRPVRQDGPAAAPRRLTL